MLILWRSKLNCVYDDDGLIFSVRLYILPDCSNTLKMAGVTTLHDTKDIRKLKVHCQVCTLSHLS